VEGICRFYLLVLGSAPYCGDGQCTDADTCLNCPDDCGPCPAECGNDICESNGGEYCNWCQADCGDYLIGCDLYPNYNLCLGGGCGWDALNNVCY
jgi:hypothetical protein